MVITDREKVVVNVENGFAGTGDLFFTYGEDGMGIIDYKTRKTKDDGKKLKVHDGQGMQLAAYAATYFGEENIRTIWGRHLIISSTEPGRFHVGDPFDLPAEWEAFKATCAVWRHSQKFDPREFHKAT